MVQSGDYTSNSDGEVSADLSGLYVGYALILLAAPTFGVAAAVGLLRVWRRSAPVDPILRSHFIFQRFTLLFLRCHGQCFGFRHIAIRSAFGRI